MGKIIMGTLHIFLLVLLCIHAHAQEKIMDSLATKERKWVIKVKTSAQPNLLNNSTDSIEAIKNFHASTKKISKKYRHINQSIQQSSDKILCKMKKHEALVYQLLKMKDTKLANEFKQNADNQYQQLQFKLATTNSMKKFENLQSYIPHVDSINTATQFIQQSTSATAKDLNQVQSVQNELKTISINTQKTEMIQQFTKARQEQIQQLLKQYGLKNPLLTMQKDMYYYKQEINNTKTMAQDESKAESKALSLLSQQPAYKRFFLKNSAIAKMFPNPNSEDGSVDNAAQLLGLQTRAGVQAQLMKQLGGGATQLQYLQAQITSAQSSIDALKNKARNGLANSQSDVSMPNFTPNTQKTKSFFDRLEYGFNIQSERPNGYLPVTTDAALTIGYKLTDNMTIGTGASYKLGWGNSLSNVTFSSQGIGLRSFLEKRLKKSFWISGGFEKNYFPKLLSAMNEVDRLHTHNANNNWKSSGLIGISKQYKIGKKNGKIQLLWDFLSYGQHPQQQPLVYRIAYTL